MIQIDIPGNRRLRLKNLVLDYNGTLARDGHLLDGVAPRLEQLATKLQIHVVTADTFGHVKEELKLLPCDLMVLPGEEQDMAKREYVGRLGYAQTCAIGNGRNDRLILSDCALGIAVMQEEGVCPEAMVAANVVIRDITMALDLLLNPLRLIATLRD